MIKSNIVILILRIIFSELGSKLNLLTGVIRVLVCEKRKDDLRLDGRMEVWEAEESELFGFLKRQSMSVI